MRRSSTKGIFILQSPVILSEAESARSAVPAQSKDPVLAGSPNRPRKAFSNQLLRPLISKHRGANVLAIFLLLSSLSFAAQTLTGTVKNSTTGKPAAGDDVVLLALGQGMEEAGRTTADSKGHFSFDVADTRSPHLVRAIHQGVTYHRMAPPGTTSVDVEVFDVAKKVDGIEVVADIMRVQAEQGSLEIVRIFGVDNTSKPPRTEMNDRDLEFYVPEGAQIVEASATTEGGNPLKTAPVQEREKTRYAFLFPLRPGTTKFEVAYQMPYTGSANVDPKSIYPLRHFVAVLPKAMQFTTTPAAGFQSIADPNQPDANMQVASNTKVGQALAFKISGDGTFAPSPENGGAPGDTGPTQSAPGSAPSAQNETRPGGGLGPPIDAPDPLQKYRWYILGGIALALIVGGVFIASRQQSAARALRSKSPRVRDQQDAEGDFENNDETEISSARDTRAQSGKAPTSMLLEGLKEELFELEVERRQGHISQQDYEKAKAALDYTLDRALKREAQKA
jgi:hypothetical protein